MFCLKFCEFIKSYDQSTKNRCHRHHYGYWQNEISLHQYFGYEVSLLLNVFSDGIDGNPWTDGKLWTDEKVDADDDVLVEMKALMLIEGYVNSHALDWKTSPQSAVVCCLNSKEKLGVSTLDLLECICLCALLHSCMLNAGLFSLLIGRCHKTAHRHNRTIDHRLYS